MKNLTWQNPEQLFVAQELINKVKSKCCGIKVSDFFGYENKELSDRNDKTLSKRFLSIEGIWKFNWVQNANERPLDFYSLNLDDSNWGKMPIPGCWELISGKGHYLKMISCK